MNQIEYKCKYKYKCTNTCTDVKITMSLLALHISCEDRVISSTSDSQYCRLLIWFL